MRTTDFSTPKRKKRFGPSKYVKKHKKVLAESNLFDYNRGSWKETGTNPVSQLNTVPSVGPFSHREKTTSNEER
jgi:hypothetical protein